ncbi:hypothetical protein [Heyndrickxia acidicola]|uniref:Uncharacterized protein n=1 Tax=Heyndrickxia acidicola TaxID=209389 RepID=A0ABU6MMY2_9BACI|nr:hypothetical protein [Heyndrickxia acidicola]MED1205865.1 hypothetical protein [Heyndrickxia acidicola]
MTAHTIKFHDFMSGDYKAKKKARRNKIIKNTVSIASSVTIPLLLTGGVGAVGLVMAGVKTVAATTNSVTVNGAVAVPVGVNEYLGENTIRTLAHALDPLIDILVAISLPVASVVMIGGCFYFLLGKPEKAWQAIQNAGLGYVLIQLSPLFIKVLEQVGKAV